MDYADKQFGKPVKLTFVRPFARVRFLFKLADGLTVDLADIESLDYSFGPVTPTDPGKIVFKGDFEMYYWLTGTTTASWQTTPSNDLGAATNALKKAGRWYYVLPAHSADQGPFKLTMPIGAENREAVVPEDMMDWLPGYEYTYIFKITDEGIFVLKLEVYSTYNTWTNVNGEYEIYNW